jgi:hypothetical protein
MDFARNDYISSDNVVGSTSLMMGDAENKKLSVGRYRSFTQRALQELSFDTFFDIKRFDLPIPENLYLDLPPGTFSVKEVYVFNGDECNIQNAQKLWWKGNYYTRGNGFFAKNRGVNNIIDPFYPSGGGLVRDQNSQDLVRVEGMIQNKLLFYNVENGQMMLSPACKQYQKIHIRAHGSICPLGEIPLIPPFFQMAVEDFVCEFASRELMAGDEGQKYAFLNKTYQQRLDYSGMYGSWFKAKQRIKTMSKGERDDFFEYFSRWSW